MTGSEPPGARTDRALSEFFSEAQEIVEWLSRDLLLLDQCQKRGEQDPDLLNNVFRAVHTLKGLSGLFGVGRMTSLSHNLENVLDDLRLGRMALSAEVLDLLFDSVELYNRMLGDLKAGVDAEGSEVEDLLVRLDRAAAKKPTGQNVTLGEYELDAGLLAVLTEYEEHRLRTNVNGGCNLFRLCAHFELSVIDTDLEALKLAAKPFGEIITFLPSSTGSTEDAIDLDILLASHRPFAEVAKALSSDKVQVIEVPRKFVGRPTVLPAPPPAAGAPGTLPVGAELSAPFGEIDSAPSFPSSAPPGPPTALEHVSAPTTIRSVSQTVRVDIRKLDRLMNIVGELSIFGNAFARVGERIRAAGLLKELGPELHRMNRGFDRQLSDLQEGILEVRMVPLGQVFDKLARIVRQISREEAKEIRFVVSGSDTEVDKLIVEELSDPLMHLIRNAIDHGIEHSAERQAAGKPAVGTIALNAYQKGSHVVLEVEDDGRGIDEEELLRTAIDRGFITVESGRELSRRDLLGLVFLPGLSTKRTADELSGRGVGMDVVKTNISRLGGVIDVQSEVGIGTKLTITLPITLAIISALVVEVADRTFALALSTVQEALPLRADQLRTIEGREVISLRGATLPLCRLGQLFGWEEQAGPRTEYIVVAGMAGRRVGFVVDRLIGQQDIVIKALGRSLSAIRGLAGATDLGADGLALVLDVPSLVEEVLALELRTSEIGARP
ncbi:MAG: chemotaxis protein CheA [Deltaproteobacteria bacterium]|nr:chemotaxis protein CheA [Deltaproteobacteria bacterium]